jgi:thiol-disulfide isomerase/thioredoxin
MLINVSKKIELVANLVIIVVACLLAIVLVRNYFWTRPSEQPIKPQEQSSVANRPPNVSSLDIDWKQNRQTLVLAISTSCHFCTDSAPFYQALVKSKKDARVVAVLPQPVEEGRAYLEKLGVSVDEIRQLRLDKIGVQGTPTLLLVDASGEVKAFWFGRLPLEKERDVLNRLQS